MITPTEIFKKNQVLTLAIAKTLIGKTIICTSSEYHANSCSVSTITIAAIVSEWDYYATQPCEGYASRTAYWQSYMTAKQIDEQKERMRIVGKDGCAYYSAHTKLWQGMYPEPTFTGSDADREVYYVLIDLSK